MLGKMFCNMETVEERSRGEVAITTPTWLQSCPCPKGLIRMTQVLPNTGSVIWLAIDGEGVVDQ